MACCPTCLCNGEGKQCSREVPFAQYWPPPPSLSPSLPPYSCPPPARRSPLHPLPSLPPPSYESSALPLPSLHLPLPLPFLLLPMPSQPFPLPSPRLPLPFSRPYDLSTLRWFPLKRRGASSGVRVRARVCSCGGPAALRVESKATSKLPLIPLPFWRTDLKAVRLARGGVGEGGMWGEERRTRRIRRAVCGMCV